MSVAIPVQSLELTPGSAVSIHNLSWKEFEDILADLGESRSIRLTYYRGTLELMSPKAIHERPHRIISDIVKALLDASDRDWEDFGSTTFKRPQLAGVEPDSCLYIDNALRVRGCTDMNLETYPPPDLAIECDVTSRTTLQVYQLLEVPEVWIYSDGQLTIYRLNDERTYESEQASGIFPDIDLIEQIPMLVQAAITEGTSKMLRKLRAEIAKINDK